MIIRPLPPLPLAEWPEADSATWAAACQPGIRLKQRGGRASHFAPEIREDLQVRYGRYLRFLQRKGLLDGASLTPQVVSPERVTEFINYVRPLWSSVTVARSIYKLRRVAEILSPAADFEWLVEIEMHLEMVAVPKERFDRIVTSEVIARAGLTLVRKAQKDYRRRTFWRARQVRDGLMIAMLAFHPIRLKNFWQLELGKSFVRAQDRWVIKLDARKTKTLRPDMRFVAKDLHQAIALYLTWARPLLLRMTEERIDDDADVATRSRVAGGCTVDPPTGSSDALWIGQYGEVLGYHDVHRRIKETTMATIGVALSPHDFRRCAAVTARFRAGSEPHLASGILQHVDQRIVDENYNLATSMEAALAFAEIVNDLDG
jgi:hypothetical protein